MKRALLLCAFFLFMFSCDYQDNGLTSIDDSITSDYLLAGSLDSFISQFQIVRLTGKPGTTTISIGDADLSKYQPCFVLYVASGPAPETTVSSAIIKLDGMVVLSTSDFSKNRGQYTFEVCNLCSTSVLTVEVRGEPGSFVNVWIEGKLKEIDADGDGYLSSEGDCNDAEPTIHPGATEICGDGIDQDCNNTDLLCPDDIDDDGDSYTENAGDCVDSDSSIHPGALEICGDGIDQDCDGADLICPDTDGDGVADIKDNCPNVPNPDQTDSDGNGTGDVCETVTDIDGNVYNVIIFGEQWWLRENLRTSRYSNGDIIPNITSYSTWDGLTEGAYCDYDNNPEFASTYGHLYKWWTVADARNVCPDGWHVPSLPEWEALRNYLIDNNYAYSGPGSTDIAKSMAASSGWTMYGDPGTVGNDQASNNSSGFNMRPGGHRTPDGEFLAQGVTSPCWTITEVEGNIYQAIRVSLYAHWNDLNIYSLPKGYGFGIRCVKNQ